MSVSGHFRRGCSARADCPNRFVCNQNTREVRVGQTSEPSLKLALQDALGQVPLALGQRFSDANNRREPASSAAFVLRFTVSSVSPKYCRRSECPIITRAAPHLDQHARRNFSGKSPFALPVHILRRDSDGGAAGSFDGRSERRERRRDDNVAMLRMRRPAA